MLNRCLLIYAEGMRQLQNRDEVSPEVFNDKAPPRQKLRGVKSGVKEPETGAPGASRTRDPLLRRQLLYPTELRAQLIDMKYIVY